MIMWFNISGFSDKILTWLEDFVFQLSNDIRDEVGIRIGEERHRCYQRPAVIVDDVFSEFFWKFSQDDFLVEELPLVPVLEVFRDPLAHFSW